MLNLKATSKPDIELELDQPRLAVGRDPSNALVLDDESISGFHAEIFVDEDQVELVDLGSTNGTFVDGQPVHGRCELRAWQKVRFGQVEMEVVDPNRRRPTTTMAAISDDVARNDGSDVPSSRPASHSAQRDGKVMGRLALTSSGDFPRIFDLGSACTVGRETPSDLRLHSDMISSSHAKLEWRGDHFVVTDLDSTNGTRINGRRIQSERLSPGDRIAFDEIEYVFTTGDEGRKGRTRVNPAIRERSGTTVRPSVSTEDAASDSTRRAGPQITQPTVASEDRAQVAQPSSNESPSEENAESTSDAPARTRVQKAAGPPARAPVLPRQQSQPAPVTPEKPAQTAPATSPTETASQSIQAPADTEQHRPAERQSDRTSQPVVVKQGGNGCVIALLVIILLIVALPIIAVVFKVGFLMSILAYVRSMIPFL